MGRYDFFFFSFVISYKLIVFIQRIFFFEKWERNQFRRNGHRSMIFPANGTKYHPEDQLLHELLSAPHLFISIDSPNHDHLCTDRINRIVRFNFLFTRLSIAWTKGKSFFSFFQILIYYLWCTQCSVWFYVVVVSVRSHWSAAYFYFSSVTLFFFFLIWYCRVPSDKIAMGLSLIYFCLAQRGRTGRKLFAVSIRCN